MILNLKPETEAIFQNAAQVRGITLPELMDDVAQELAHQIALEEEQDLRQDEEDLETLRERLKNPDPRPNRTLDELRQHIASLRVSTQNGQHGDEPDKSS